MPLRHTVEEIILKNGAKGLIVDVPDSTVVSYSVHFLAGNQYADKSVEQTAHIMEHMAFGANEKYSTAESFSQEFTKNGALSNAYTGEKYMRYVADCSAMEWDRILDLQELSITKPKYSQTSLDAEKGNVTEELKANVNDHPRFLWQHIRKAVGHDTLTSLEQLDTVGRINLADIIKHHAKTHTSNNMRFVFAGDLLKHKLSIIDKMNDWDLPAGNRLPIQKTTPVSSPLVYIHRAEMTNLVFGFSLEIGRELSRLELICMGVLRHVLTGTFHSRIFGKARSQGVCYSMGSDYYTDTSSVAAWNIFGRVGANENADKLFCLIKTQIESLICDGISEDELSDAKQFSIGGYQMRCQTVKSLCEWYSYDYYDHDSIRALDETPELIQSVTSEDVIKLAREFIYNGRWTYGAIGNVTKDQSQLHYDIFADIFSKRVE